MRPVPTTASRMAAVSDRSHELGHAEREVERLTPVQARIAERLVPVVELLLEHRLGPPRHSVTSSPVNSRWTPPGHVPTSRCEEKNPCSSSMIASKWRVFRPLAVRTRFPCIGSHAHTTGIADSRTARRSGGSFSLTFAAPIRAMKVSLPGRGRD